jgi:hypothetical protein
MARVNIPPSVAMTFIMDYLWMSTIVAAIYKLNLLTTVSALVYAGYSLRKCIYRYIENNL